MVTTQAAVLRAADGPFQIETVEVNEPTAGEVVVQIAGVGICHTDFLPRTPVAKPPIVVGHEGAGTIVAVGPGVTNRAVGDRVILSFDHCGQCRNCGDGQPGYFSLYLRVYGRGGQPCPGCGTRLKEIRQGQRSTVYCPRCQH